MKIVVRSMALDLRFVVFFVHTHTSILSYVKSLRQEFRSLANVGVRERHRATMMMPTDPWRTRIEGAPATLRVARAHPVHVTAAPPPARRPSAAQLAALVRGTRCFEKSNGIFGVRG